mgnify:CR=1 FL=1
MNESCYSITEDEELRPDGSKVENVGEGFVLQAPFGECTKHTTAFLLQLHCFGKKHKVTFELVGPLLFAKSILDEEIHEEQSRHINTKPTAPAISLSWKILLLHYQLWKPARTPVPATCLQQQVTSKRVHHLDGALFLLLIHG